MVLLYSVVIFLNKKRKLALFFIFSIVDIILLIVFLVVRDATIYNDLESEVSRLSKIDYLTEKCNPSIRSRGGYAVLEKSFKNYINNYYDDYHDILILINDDKFKSILSYDNYSNDGPLFDFSIDYLNSVKNDFNNNIDNLIKMSSRKSISSYLYSKTSDSYFIKVADDLFLQDEVIAVFNRDKLVLIDIKDKVNKIIDNSLAVLSFLSTTSDYWILEDGEIKFVNQDLVIQYNNLVNDIPKQGN